MEQRAVRGVCVARCLTGAAANSCGLQASVPRVPSPRVPGAAACPRAPCALLPAAPCSLRLCHCRTCCSPPMFLQAAVAARIDVARPAIITSLAAGGLVERVRDRLFANPAEVHFLAHECVIFRRDCSFVLNVVTLVFFSVDRLLCIGLLCMVTRTFASSWSSVKLT